MPEPLYLPELDPRTETQLVEGAIVRVYNASAGRLNDFSASSVPRALIEGQAFAGSELLYYINQLPLALLVQFLQVSGVERRLGVAAAVQLTFTLSQVLGTPYSIPAGFVVSDASGQHLYTTDVLLIIPAGAVSGVVSATAIELGTAYNLAPYQITTYSQPLTYLSAVTNLAAATGGADQESIEDAIARGLDAIRRRNLVTADDYEEEAITFLGEGATAKAIGLLSGDKISYELGAVHLFVLNVDGTQPNTTQLTALQLALRTRIQIGTSLYCSPIDLLTVDGDLVAKLGTGQDPNTVAQTLWAAFQEYLDPTQFAVGESIVLKEVEYALRLAGGIEYIQALTINNQGTNLPMPYRYSLPKAHSLYCSLVNDTGETYKILLGAGESYVG